MTDKLTPDEIRAELRKLAKAQGLDPELAEAALDPEKEIPAELMDVLTLVAEKLAGVGKNQN
ncbi:MAG: hypothetical protein KKB70_08035 [Proteobacteria bacterium]|nr:hypothetical protein [Pseudomonadota bacterium]MBU1612168.1 hypothetical protein [Pseudomonadota bacterium]